MKSSSTSSCTRIGIRRRLVYLIYDDDRLQAELQGFFQDEARLRHRAFLGVDDQKDRVDGTQHALDLRAEIRVARSVDDVYLGRPCRLDRGIFRVNGNAALLFERVRVHRALVAMAALGHDGVGKSGLAVVDVGYDGYVSYFHECNSAAVAAS